MSNSDAHIQCFFFLPKTTSGHGIRKCPLSSNKTTEAFVLLPHSVVKDDCEVVQLFSRNSIEILTLLNCAPLLEALARNDVDTLELIVRKDPKRFLFTSETTPFLPVHVEALDHLERIEAFLGKDAAIYWDPMDSRNLCFRTDAEIYWDSLNSRNHCLTASEGNIEIIQTLLNVSTNIGYRFWDKSLAHLAAERDDEILLRLLLDHGTNVDILNNKGETPLYSAITYGSKTAATFLLQNGAALNMRMISGETCLLAACKHIGLKIASLLVKMGADVNIGTQNGIMPLHVLIYRFGAWMSHDHGKIMDFLNELLDKGADVNASATYGLTEGFTPLCQAVLSGKFEMVKCLLKRGADVNIHCYNNQTILRLAVDSNSPELVQEILKYNPQKNCKINKDALRVAISRDGERSDKIAKLLLSSGFTSEECSNDSIEFLHTAIRKNYTSVVEQLIRSGVSVNQIYYCSHGKTPSITSSPLLTAIRYCNNDMVRLLIDLGADVNMESQWEIGVRSPLREACSSRNWTAVKILLNKNIYLENELSWGTAVDCALFSLEPEIIKIVLSQLSSKAAGRIFLLKYIFRISSDSPLMLTEMIKTGCFVNVRDVNGRTALHCLEENKYCTAVKLLIQSNADIEARDFSGQTPLHAASFGCLKVVKELLKYGAKIDSIDSHGRSPLHYAVVEDCLDVFEVLLCHAFTDFESISRTNILSFLRISTLEGLRNHGDETYFHQEFRNPMERFQNATKILLIQLMKMSKVFPDDTNLVDFVQKEIKPGSFTDTRDYDTTAFGLSSCFRKFNCGMFEVEVNKIKLQNIGDSSITLFDILTKNEEQLACYFRNEHIASSLSFEELPERSFFFRNFIHCQIQKGAFRRKLLDLSIKLCRFLISEFDTLPADLKEKVLKYLSNKDLEVLIHACVCVSGSSLEKCLSERNSQI